jgi:hypothetical protein
VRGWKGGSDDVAEVKGTSTRISSQRTRFASIPTKGKCLAQGLKLGPSLYGQLVELVWGDSKGIHKL